MQDRIMRSARVPSSKINFRSSKDFAGIGFPDFNGAETEFYSAYYQVYLTICHCIIKKYGHIAFFAV